jgi:hypothetical protein
VNVTKSRGLAWFGHRSKETQALRRAFAWVWLTEAGLIIIMAG